MHNEFVKNLISHRLFDKQGSFSWPTGYNEHVADFVKWLDEYEEKSNCKVRLMQIKMKWGYLTVYIDVPTRFDASREHIDTIYDKINQLTQSTQSICPVCGKDLVESVYDSKITFLCFDHIKESYANWNRWQIKDNKRR